MSRVMRTAVASIAAIATAVGVGACGGGVPSGAIAIVGSAPVTHAQFVHWMTIANDSQYVNTGYTPPPLPLPPSYTACINAKIAGVATGATPPTRNALEKECAASYATLSSEVETLLVEAIWVQGEAYDHHVKVTKSAINNFISSERKADFPTATKWRDFLAESGYTINDLQWIAQFDLLQQAIAKKVESSAGKISPKQIASYYHSHIATYSQPARRNIEFVLAKSDATALKARSLIAGGESFATVAKQYSIDPTTKDTGGDVLGVEQGEETPALNKAIFADPVGTLEGPIKTAFGYYVVEVTKKIAPDVESLKTASEQIKTQLADAAEESAVNALKSSFTTSWMKRTTCASGYLDTSVCGNAPKSSTGSSGTTGASGTT